MLLVRRSPPGGPVDGVPEPGTGTTVCALAVTEGSVNQHQRGRDKPTVKPLLLVDDAQLLDDHSAAALLSVVHQRGARALVTVRLGGRPPDAVTALWKTACSTGSTCSRLTWTERAPCCGRGWAARWPP